MKTSIITVLLTFALAIVAAASGVTGRVVDGRGNGKSGVTIMVKHGNNYSHTTTVKTDRNGNYTVALPGQAAGSRVKVYARGKYAATTTIPTSGDFARVNVTFK